MLALVLVGLLAGTALAAPVKPVVRNNAVQQKNYGLLTPPGLFKKVQRMNWNQEVDTVIMFGSYGDRDRAVKVLRLMAPRSSTPTR